MRIWGTLVAASICVSLGACQTPGPIITADGQGSGAAPGQSDTSNVKSIFRHAETNAVSGGNASVDSAHSRALLVAGFDLINANCADYFSKAGSTQHKLNTSRDVTVASASFLAAAMGLNSRNDEVIAALPILTGGIYAGMDVYAKNYLFSAENIGAVEDLTVRALKAHQAAQLRNVDTYIASEQVLTYGQVVAILQEDRAYCTPTRILPQVRTAISKGEVAERDPFATSGDVRSTGQKAGDLAALKEIGALYGLSGPISEEQALGYYWLYLHDSRDDEKSAIYQLLKHMPASAQPFTENGEPSASYVKIAQLEPILQRLSEPLRERFNASITAHRVKLKMGTPAAGYTPPLVSPKAWAGTGSSQGILPPVLIEVR